MKKVIAVILAALMLVTVIPLAVSAADDFKVYGPLTLEGKFAYETVDFAVSSEKEGNTAFLRCKASAGAYTNDQLKFTFIPDFSLTEYPIVLVSYRSNSNSNVIDVTLRGEKLEKWPDSHPTNQGDGKWHKLIVDINTITGGNGTVTPGLLVDFCMKPFGAGNKTLASDVYFDVEYIACFKTKAEAENFVYAGEANYEIELPDVEGFFYELADEATINNYMELTEKRIEEIKNSPTEVEVTGQKYYVSASGNDSNDGKTPETAWRSIAKVNSMRLAPGSGVFFKRGDSFRTVESLETYQGITYSAYGEGEKPQIICSLDASDASCWTLTDTANIYRYNEFIPDERDVGTIVFDGGKAWGVQVQQKTNGERLNSGYVYNGLEWFSTTTGKFDGYRDLDHNLEFYHDWDNDTLYLYCEGGNPGEVFGHIEIVDKGHGIKGSGVDVTIDNLSIYGTGSHGIGYGNVKNLTVQNCTFYWIGGSIQGKGIMDRDYGTRFGNAVESYGSSYNFKILNNYASQVYDCCWTVQCGKNAEMKDIEMAGNVSEFCNTGLEVWNSEGVVENMDLHDNITRFNGYGWSHQRPYKDGNFFYGASATDNVYKNNNVCNNLNLFASTNALLVCATAKDQYNFHDNVYVMENNKRLGGVAKDPGKGVGPQTNISYTMSNIKRAYAGGFEPGSKFYYTEPNPLGDMYAQNKQYIIPTEPNVDTTAIFTDVKSGFWGVESINYVYKNGLFGGISKNEFAPDMTMTRAMLVTVLNRLSDEGAAMPKTRPYEDVRINAWYAGVVDWAKRSDIIDDGDNFRPDDNVTREELAEMLYRYAVYKCKTLPETKTLEFADAAEVSTGRETVLSFCIESGVITGYTDKTVKPRNNATRTEVATMIMRFAKFIKASPIDYDMVSEAVKKGSTVYYASDIALLAANTGITGGLSADGKYYTTLAKAGAYENNDLVLVFGSDEIDLTEKPFVRIGYKTNSSAGKLDVSSRSMIGESWLGTQPAVSADGSMHDLFFTINDLSGGAGALRAGDKTARLWFKPFGGTVTLNSDKYFDIAYIVFAKSDLAARNIEVEF